MIEQAKTAVQEAGLAAASDPVVICWSVGSREGDEIKFTEATLMRPT
jgi:hypothetical protein